MSADTPTPDDMRAIADLDSRSGEPVGNALRFAADEIERLQAEIERLQERWERWEKAAFRMTGMSSIRERNAEYLAAATEEPTDD
jgi:chemotaxis regulatin CheY-phosphate phosphatase CheZ